MTEREELKLALEALEEIHVGNMTPMAEANWNKAITAIKEALAQPEQEPVIGTKTWFEDGKVVTQHLTAKDIYKDPEQPEQIPPSVHLNTRQPKQEPVAWSYWQSCLNDDGTQTAPWVHRLSKFKPSELIINKDIVPLYTTPPQRKPLTDEEIVLIVADCAASHQHTDIHFARAIEAAHGIKGEA